MATHKQLFLLVIGLLLSCSVFSQSVNDSLLTTARKRVEVLASAKFAGRGYDNDGHLLAANYIAEQFEQAGLLPLRKPHDKDHPYFHYFEFPYNNILDAQLSLNGTALTIGEDFIVNRASGSVTYSGKAKDVCYGLPKQMKKANGTNRVVVMREGLPEKIAANEEKAAEYKELTRLEGKLSQLSTGFPAVVGTRKKLTAAMSTDEPLAYGFIEVQADKMPKKVKTLDLTIRQEMQQVRSQNIIGWVEGSTYPDSFIIVSAHYDHLGTQGSAIFYGANDNASGTALVISMAHHFAQPANQPQYSMVFVGFGGEECGLIGSQWYVQANPAFPLAQTKFILNLDLMGNGDEGIMAVGGKDFPNRWEKLKALNEARGDAIPKVKKRANAPNSDHYWFLEKGIPGFFIYTLGGPPHYHDINDKAENLVFSRYVEVRQLLIDFLKEM